MKQQVVLFSVIAVLTAGCASTGTDTATRPAAVDASQSVPAQPAKVAPAESTKVAAVTSEDVVTASSREYTDDADRVVCRQITPTGTHRKRMVCRTVGSIKKDRQAAQDALRKRQGSSMQAPDDT